MATLRADYAPLAAAADALLAARPDVREYSRQVIQLPQTLRDLIEADWPIDESGLRQHAHEQIVSEAACVNARTDACRRAARTLRLDELPACSVPARASGGRPRTNALRRQYERPHVPARVLGTLGYMGHVPLVRGAWQWATMHGAIIDIDHPLELVSPRTGRRIDWPLLDWMFREMERRTGFDTTMLFIQQHYAANSGAVADWSRTHLPQYEPQIFDSAWPVIELAEQVLCCCQARAAIESLHMPELLAQALGRDRDAGDGRTLVKVFEIEERIERVDRELQRIVADQDLSPGVLPPKWREYFAACFAADPHQHHHPLPAGDHPAGRRGGGVVIRRRAV